MVKNHTWNYGTGYRGGVYRWDCRLSWKFLKNTDINGMDVSDMTVEEAEKLIREQVEDYQITLKERGNNSETITAEEIGYHYVFQWGNRKFSKNPSIRPVVFVSYFSDRHLMRLRRQCSMMKHC